MTEEVKRDEWISYNCFYNQKCPALPDGGTVPAQMAPGSYHPGDPKSCVAVSNYVTSDWCQQVCKGNCPTAMCRCDFATFDWPTEPAETLFVPAKGSPMQIKPQPPAAKPTPAVCTAVRPGVGAAWCDKTCISTPKLDFCSSSCHCPGWNATA